MLKIPGKIPVSIYPFFWILAFLIGWLNTASLPAALIWVAIILASVLVHEFGHALTALAFGQRVHIELVGFGGVTQRNGNNTLKLWQEFAIVLNGPLAGFALSAIAWWLFNSLRMTHPESLLTYATEVTFYVNFFWTVLNLLPVQPLDGGRLLSIFLEAIFGFKGTKIALFLSLFLAASLALLFFVIQEFFIGSLFMLFTFESYKSWKQSLALTKEDQNLILQHLLKEAQSKLQNGHREEALIAFQRIRDMVKSGLIYQKATENAADLLASKGDLKQAYETLSTLGKKLSPEGLNLMHHLAYSQKHWEQVVALGDRAYQNRPNYHVAIINAASHSALGHVKPAIGWIQCALHEGLPHLKDVLKGREFDEIRSDPLFRDFLETASP